MKRASQSRGQTMLLFMLTLLLLTLMVFITLGIGMKIREKNELQTLADTTAYSQAVVTARTYNTISIINRLEVSYFVAMAASESLISWTGGARGALYKGVSAANAIAARHSPGCAKGNVCDCDFVAKASMVSNSLNAAVTSSWSQWHQDDHTAGFDTKAIQGIIHGLTAETMDKAGMSDMMSSAITPPSGGTMLGVLQNHSLAKDIVKLANRGSVVANELSVVKQDISHREVDCRVNGTYTSANNGMYTGAPGVCILTASDTMEPAAMGSRGNSWVRQRGQPPNLTKYLGTYAPGINAGGHQVVVSSDSGTGTWGRSKHDVTAGHSAYAWGDDHMTVNVTVRASCGSDSQSESFDAWVKSTDIDDNSDTHVYPGSGIEKDEKQWHTMGDCGNSCPSVWVRSLEFSSSGANDNWGMPKNYAVIERDYSKRKKKDLDPWNLMFNFRFTKGTAGTDFDNRGIALADGTDISNAIAIGTGLSYYHRPQHWREFPNFLNPYWRATLVSADTDRQGQYQFGGKDISNVLSKNPWQQKAYQELIKAGFRGVP